MRSPDRSKPWAWFAVVLILGISGMGAAWQEKMKDLDRVLQDLLLDTTSDARFNNPANYSRIEKNAEKFARLAHELGSKKVPPPDADPTLQILAGELAREADFGVIALKGGNREYARDVLQSTMNYCITCHTRTTDPKFKMPASGLVPEDLRGVERADYYAASRQFDLALAEYRKIIDRPEAFKMQPYSWERAIRSGLAIAVRVKKDPDHALEISEKVIATPSAPFFIREQTKAWKKSLLAWKAEPRMQAGTEEGYYALATRLVAEAREAQKYPADRSADVIYLRASAAVHDLLSLTPNGKRSAEGLYLAGLCYEVLEDMNLWDLHETYYLACILKAPHTEVARRCFKHYEQSVYLGYSGSLGEDLPSDVQKNLRRLDKLSSPFEDAPKEAL